METHAAADDSVGAAWSRRECRCAPGVSAAGLPAPGSVATMTGLSVSRRRGVTSRGGSVGSLAEGSWASSKLLHARLPRKNHVGPEQADLSLFFSG